MRNAERTLQHLKKNGIDCWPVERWVPRGPNFGLRIDLFNIIDIIALYPGQIVGIQACGADFKPHDDKIKESEYSVKWLRSNGALELWGWRKVKVKRGGKAMIWQPRVKKYTLEDLE